jgi:four helix bundle protein
MQAKCVEELQIFQRARLLARAVFAWAVEQNDHRGLREQLLDCAGSIPANIAEGFSQTTDRAFARYLAIAAGSSEELRVHLQTAQDLKMIDGNRALALLDEARQITYMLRGFVRYLRRCDRKDRFVKSD